MRRPQRVRCRPIASAHRTISWRTRKSLAIVFAVVFGSAASPPARGGCVPFSLPPEISSSADGASAVFAADLDGDGDLDVVSASVVDNKVAWYENTAGDGSAWSTHTIALSAINASSVFAADVDGDGDLDVLSASHLDDEVAWYENTAGDGSAWSTHAITTSADGAYSVFAADMDGDGDFDVLSASYADYAVNWYENTAGDGSAWSTHTITTSAAGSNAVFAVDVDGDGDVDALASSWFDDTIAWYENTAGDGSTWSRHAIATSEDYAVSVAAADVDGDGDLDALSTSMGDDTIAWHENTGGDASSWTTREIWTAANGAYSVVAADMDGDGDLDAVTASWNDDTVAWHENSAGNGSAWITHRLTTSADQANTVFAADVDGDGDLDVLSASWGDDTVAWYRNDRIHGKPLFLDVATVGALVSGAFAVLTADIDRDGDLDVVSSANHIDEIAWRENVAGDGSGWIRHTMTTAADYPHELFLTDLDRDGDLDVLSASRLDGAIAWTENESPGDGSSWTLHTIVTVGAIATIDTEAWNVTGADLDGDGDLDAVVSLYRDDVLVWFENGLPASSSWTLHTLATGFDGVWYVTSADVDGDGDADVVAGRRTTTDEFAWFENDGSGGGWTEVSIRSGGSDSRQIEAADVDSDGDLDFFSSDASLAAVEWHENLGGGGSWSLHTVATGLYTAWSVHALDIDGDGDVDVASASAQDDKIAWHENNGTGSGWTTHVLTTATDYAMKVWAADIDGDGDIDLVASSDYDSRITWLENRGTKIFSHGFDTELGGSVNLICWSNANN
jgi:hypothetical protein